MTVRLPTRHLQEIKILLTAVKYAEPTGSIDKKINDLLREVNEIFTNRNNLDDHLYALNKNGLIIYEEIGEDGFAPYIMAGITEKTYSRLAELIYQVEQETIELEKQLKELLTFDPEQITAQILTAQAQLHQARVTVENNTLLKPILQPIAEIQRHFESVVSVSSTYENVYKNIIRPVQREGEAGVKATVRWAIVSIVVSTFISMAIGNWHEIKRLWSMPNNTPQSTMPASGSHGS